MTEREGALEHALAELLSAAESFRAATPPGFWSRLTVATRKARDALALPREPTIFLARIVEAPPPTCGYCGHVPHAPECPVAADRFPLDITR